MGRRVLRVLLGAVAIIILASIGFLVWARQPTIASITQPNPSKFAKSLVAEGATLVAMGDCAECHTAPGGKPFAGGYPLPTPFGTVYGMNITPDPQTGIGQWSEAAFRRAIRRGIGRTGEFLYPAFPYPHFTGISDTDVAAIYAYLMTRPPVHHVVPPPRLPFPLDIRPLIAGWNLFFFDRGRFEPNAQKSAAWNRGAYIAEGLGHCGDCHTPRNVLGAESTQNRYAGGESEGWRAPALNRSSPAPVPWTKDQLATYLTAGFANQHGAAAGPMAGVAHELQKLPASDVTALATYIASLGRPAAAASTDQALTAAHKVAYHVATAQAMAQNGPATTGQTIFAGACASCHFEGGDQPYYRPVPLRLSSVVNARRARNFIQIVMHGIQPPTGERGRWMPPFGTVLDNRQIAMLAHYVRSHFSGKPAWTDVDETVAQIRESTGQ